MSATIVATIEDFFMSSAWACNNGSFSSRPTRSTAYKTFTVSGLPENSIVQSVVFSVDVGSPLSGIDELTINNQNASSYSLETFTQDVSSIVTGNGQFTFSFVFRANGNPNMSDGQHSGSLTFSNCTITLTYEENTEPIPPEEEEEIVFESSRLVCLFDKNAKSFDGNGICVLNPISCVVNEIAGGAYELEMQHPIDAHGKWAMIENESIIRAPVPPNVIPQITLPSAKVWQVKNSVTNTPLYTRLPTYTPAKTPVDDIKANPSIFAWNSSKVYDAGDYCILDDSIYKAYVINSNREPDVYTYIWMYVTAVNSSGGGSSSSGGTYDPGTIAERIPGGELITKIADYNATYIRARSLRGITGYVKRADCVETSGTVIGQIVPRRIITAQAFRVYNIECEDDTQTITVSAKHISYDFQRNSLFDCQLTEADPATAIAILQGSLIGVDDRLIACDITSPTISVDWSFQNPVYALLDPDEGLLSFLQGMLIRDNADYFILNNSSPRKGPRIAYGVNMRGVQWSRNTEDVVTRIVPRCGDGKDGYLYLDELYIDSDYIADYSVPSIEILDCDCYVGQEIEHADGTKQTLTRENCLQIMREKAEKRFAIDKADAVTVSLDVQFVLLGDTDEYKQYRALQRLNIYDEIQVNTGPSGMAITAQVTGYEWDCINRRYNSIALGNVFSAKRQRIPGFRVNDGAVTYGKLAPGLISKIKGGNI